MSTYCQEADDSEMICGSPIPINNDLEKCSTTSMVSTFQSSITESESSMSQSSTFKIKNDINFQ